MHKLQIIEIGNELGILLPREMTDAMHLEKGSTIVAIVDSDGVLLKSADERPSLPADR